MRKATKKKAKTGRKTRGVSVEAGKGPYVLLIKKGKKGTTQIYLCKKKGERKKRRALSVLQYAK
jgi:hypothetical protein